MTINKMNNLKDPTRITIAFNIIAQRLRLVLFLLMPIMPSTNPIIARKINDPSMLEAIISLKTYCPANAITTAFTL